MSPTKESATVVGGDDFMHTDDFRRLFVGFVMVDTLVAMRWLDRKWHKVVEKKLIELEDEPFGEIVVGGNDISDDEAYSGARLEKMKRLAKFVFLLNITKVLHTTINNNYYLMHKLNYKSIIISSGTFP